MAYSTPEQLSFPPVAGHTLRTDFEGGALSSDFGVLLLRGIDRQIGLTARLAAAIHDTRHSSYIDHPLRDLLAQRTLKSPPAMRTAMMPTASVVIPCLRWAWNTLHWLQSRTWRVRRLSRDLNTAWTVRTSLGSPRHWWPTLSPATRSRLRPSCSTSITRTIQPMGSRNWRSTTITIRIITICLC